MRRGQEEKMSKRCLSDETDRLGEFLVSFFIAEGVGESLTHTINYLYQRDQKTGYQNNEE